MSRRLVGAFAATAIMLVVVGGCQAIVGDTVPDFFCRGSDPAACPSGMVCDPTSQRCVASLTNNGEAGSDADLGTDSPVEDAAPDKVTPKDGDAGPAAPGAPCRIDADCSTKMCGDGTLLTPTIVANSQPAFRKLTLPASSTPWAFWKMRWGSPMCGRISRSNVPCIARLWIPKKLPAFAAG